MSDTHTFRVLLQKAGVNQPIDYLVGLSIWLSSPATGQQPFEGYIMLNYSHVYAFVLNSMFSMMGLIPFTGGDDKLQPGSTCLQRSC